MSHKTIFLKNKNALETIYLRRFFLDFTHFSFDKLRHKNFTKCGIIN
nr:MAG TPA: hypothetical protein [Caudoviricetes sp.]